MKNIVLICLSIFLLSCSSKKIFTPEYRNLLDQNDISVKRLQFYNNIPIELKRKISQYDIKTVKGEVKVENGEHYEYIYFPKQIEGRCLNESENYSYIEVYFEKIGYLTFRT